VVVAAFTLSVVSIFTGIYMVAGILCGIAVVAGFFIALWKLSRSMGRLHEAMFGYDEGSTHVKGVYETTVGNGHGDVLEVALDAKAQIGSVADKLDAHISADAATWELIRASLQSLGAKVPPEVPAA
jgi:hypothetical protein